jgi:hypothetical protein
MPVGPKLDFGKRSGPLPDVSGILCLTFSPLGPYLRCILNMRP